MPWSISSIGLPKKLHLEHFLRIFSTPSSSLPLVHFISFLFLLKKKRDFDMFPNLQLISTKAGGSYHGSNTGSLPPVRRKNRYKVEGFALLNKQFCRTYLITQKQRCCKQKKKKKKKRSITQQRCISSYTYAPQNRFALSSSVL